MQEEPKDDTLESEPAKLDEPSEASDTASTAEALPGSDQDDSLQSSDAPALPALPAPPAAPAAADEGTAPAEEAPLVEGELAPQAMDARDVADANSEQPDGQVEPTAEDLAAEAQAIDPKIDSGLLEAYLFSTHSPLTGGKLAELFNLESTKPIRKAVRMLNEQYEQTGRCFRVEQVAGGFQLLTLPNYGEPLKALHQKEADAKLTKAALETLAIIAYKQPILRADLEAIRGVASGETVRSLMEKHLVKIAGRAEEPGRPILYGTTKRFLEVFGLNSLKDLPQPEALQNRARQQQLTSVAEETAAEAAPAAEPAVATASSEPAVIEVQTPAPEAAAVGNEQATESAPAENQEAPTEASAAESAAERPAADDTDAAGK